MRKKSQDELGTLVTREMKVMLQDASLTKEQRFDILTAVMFDVPIKNALLASFAKSLKAGFDKINATKWKAVEKHRQAAKEEAARARAAKKRLEAWLNEASDTPIIGNNGKQLKSIDINGNQLITTSRQMQSRCNNIISPCKPPKGGKREPEKVRPEDLLEVKGRRGGSTDKLAQRRRGAEDGVRTATLGELAVILAEDIEKTDAFAHMRVNRRNLMRYLIPLVKKNCAAEDGDESGTSDEQRQAFGKLRQLILAGLAAWTEAWKADDWQFAPGKITKWLADEKWLEKPRKKAAAPAEGSGCGECGAEIV